MDFKFDYFDQFELPPIYLTQPNGTQLYMLGNISNRELKLRFNALSEFTFTASKYIDGELNRYYDYLDYRRLVYIDGIMRFMIVGIDESNDGMMQEKKITCQSLECELNFKKLSLFKTTTINEETGASVSASIKFWDDFTPQTTLLGRIVEYIPGWTVKYVDPSLKSLARSFDITDMSIYAFLMNNVSQSYQVIFKFDTINKWIYAYSTVNATSNTDIFLSYNNLVEETSIETITDELVTALNVYGGGGLDISRVNPLGSNTIYNFDYYKNINWMSSDLITAIDDWETLIESIRIPYANTLTSIQNANILLLDKKAELSNLYTAPYPDGMDALKEIQTVRLKEGSPEPIAEINALIVAKQNEIYSKNSEIQYIGNQLASLVNILTNYNSQVSFENNFTPAQIIELSSFIIGSTYTNETWIKTDETSPVDVQTYSQGLYDQAQTILAKISEPRYNFAVTTANFVFLKEFQKFINQIDLGCVVTIEFDNGLYNYPVLLEMDFSYDDPNNFKLLFSNRLRLDDSAFQFSDLFAQSVNSGLTTTFNSEKWSSWENYSKNDVTTFINSALDASKNAVINATNQEIVIDANGMTGRYLIDPVENIYDDRQFKMINNMLVFTNDGWDSAALAIGEITNPAGSKSYGLVADTIVGRLLAGNELIIENDALNFRLDGTGATLTNAKFTINSQNSQIVLNPDAGISISKRDPLTNLFTDRRFYVDDDGNVIFKGDLSGASGTFSGEINATSGNIGGWIIRDDGLYSPNGNDYIKSNGDTRLGLMTIDNSGGKAYFNGDIYADNLQGYVYGDQLMDIDADTITAGTLRGIDIYGENIYWPGVRMYSPGHGISIIDAENQISMVSLTGNVGLNGKTVSLNGYSISIGNPVDSITKLSGRIDAINAEYERGTGISETIMVTTSFGPRALTFINGLLCKPLVSGSQPANQIGDLIFEFDVDQDGWLFTQVGADGSGYWNSGFLELHTTSATANNIVRWDYVANQSVTILADSNFAYNSERFGIDSYLFVTAWGEEVIGKQIKQITFILDTSSTFQKLQYRWIDTDDVEYNIAYGYVGVTHPYSEKFFSMYITNVQIG